MATYVLAPCDARSSATKLLAKQVLVFLLLFQLPLKELKIKKYVV